MEPFRIPSPPQTGEREGVRGKDKRGNSYTIQLFHLFKILWTPVSTGVTTFYENIIVEETPDYIKFKIIRFIRLYGAPFIWPQASIKVWINAEEQRFLCWT